MLKALFLCLLFAVPAWAQERPCGVDAACEIEGGAYYLMFPQDWDGVSALPTLIFYHGHRSSGASIFRARNIQRAFRDRGYLVIGPNGVPLQGNGFRWPARRLGQGARDDVAFTLAVLDDAQARVPIDAGRVYVAGFSAGGSQAWMMACHASARFAGFVSVSGALRRPVPDTACPSESARLLQLHGFADLQVPLEGRGINDWHQGDVFESFGLLRETNQCASRPDSVDITDALWCRSWTSCGSGALRMCLHPGGHGFPKGWAELARAWFENAGN